MTFADEYIRRALRLNRVSEGEFAEDAVRLREIREQIREQLDRLDSDSISSARRNEIAFGIATIIEENFTEFADRANEIATEAVRKEIEFNTELLATFTDEVINAPVLAVAVQDVQNREFRGRTFTQWYQATGITASRAVLDRIQTGLIAGEPIPSVTRGVQGPVNQTGHNIRTLVRSNLLAASNRARELVVDENVDLFEGKVWISTLDIRTTPHICGIRDQQMYTNENEPVGHDLPWEAGPGAIHFNCRSTFIPKIEGVDIDAPRPSVGAGDDYDRGDNTTRTGRVRKPTKRNRDNGIFEIDQQSAGTTYEEWLRTQPQDFIADALGSQSGAAAFKNGQALETVTDNIFGTNLTIDQL